MAAQRIAASFTPGAPGPQFVVAGADLSDDLAPGMQVELVEETSGLAYLAVVLRVLGDHRFEALVDSVRVERAGRDRAIM
ncbi:MAG: hypothetical protein R2733_24440 [Acidimicrobiales bacterium]